MKSAYSGAMAYAVSPFVMLYYYSMTDFDCQCFFHFSA